MTNNPTIDGVSREQIPKFRALGQMDQRSRKGGAEYVRLSDYDAQQSTIASLEARITQLESEKEFAAATYQAARDRIAELESGQGEPFQDRVQPWMMDCFGAAISGDREERNHRFLEEALELVQACGASASEAHQLVEYVYGRPVGEPAQEVGGVMVTLAALCLANGLDMHANGETELARIWTKVDQIRAKQAAKPAMSPLPGVYTDRALPAPVAVVPDGWKLVPVEPTELMIRRGDQNYSWSVAKIYKAMIEDAPDCLDATAALNEVKP